MSLYLRLFHGRKSPEEVLEDWGKDGPVFGSFDWISMTYLSSIRMGHESADFELFRVLDLIYYDGMYYGDVSIGSSKSGFDKKHFQDFDDELAKLPKGAKNISKQSLTESEDFDKDSDGDSDDDDDND